MILKARPLAFTQYPRGALVTARRNGSRRRNMRGNLTTTMGSHPSTSCRPSLLERPARYGWPRAMLITARVRRGCSKKHVLGPEQVSTRRARTWFAPLVRGTGEALKWVQFWADESKNHQLEQSSEVDLRKPTGKSITQGLIDGIPGGCYLYQLHAKGMAWQSRLQSIRPEDIFNS